MVTSDLSYPDHKSAKMMEIRETRK